MPGVIAWSREAQPDVGEYGPPTTLFVSGDVPDMGWRHRMGKLPALLASAMFFRIGSALVRQAVR